MFALQLCPGAGVAHTHTRQKANWSRATRERGHGAFAYSFFFAPYRIKREWTLVWFSEMAFKHRVSTQRKHRNEKNCLQCQNYISLKKWIQVSHQEKTKFIGYLHGINRMAFPCWLHFHIYVFVKEQYWKNPESLTKL